LIVQQEKEKRREEKKRKDPIIRKTIGLKEKKIQIKDKKKITNAFSRFQVRDETANALTASKWSG